MRDNQRRERLNALIRAELKRDGRLGESIHIGGYEFAVGDRVVARRNDRERAVDNGMRGTVIAVDPTEKELSCAPTPAPNAASMLRMWPSISSTPTH